MKSRSLVCHPPRASQACHMSRTKLTCDIYSPPPGHEAGPSCGYQVPRQVPGPVCPHFWRSGIQQCANDRGSPLNTNSSACPRADTNCAQPQWESVEKSQVQEKKIRVVFLPAAGAGSAGGVAATPVKQPHLTNGVSFHVLHIAKTTFSSDSPTGRANSGYRPSTCLRLTGRAPTRQQQCSPI